MPIPESWDVTLKVHREDLLTGERYNCRRCPVALALERAVIEKFGGGYHSITVGSTMASVFFNSKLWLKAELPNDTQSFISSFDQGLLDPAAFNGEEEFPLHFDLVRSI